jgi:hypothetical protein
VAEFEARCYRKDLDLPQFRKNGREGDTTLLTPFVKKRDDLSLVLDIELDDAVQCGQPVCLLWAGNVHLGDQHVLLAEVDRRLIDFCDEDASIDQLHSGLNNEIGLVADIVYLRHVMRREVDKLLLNADDVFHVRALAIDRNSDQFVGPQHTERAEKRHEHFDLQVSCVTTEVWHRDQMKIVDDPFDKDADADDEECGAAMGASIKRDRKHLHVGAREQDADLHQSDADKHADILADQMATHIAQIAPCSSHHACVRLRLRSAEMTCRMTRA